MNATQKELLDLLILFDKLCRTNNLSYHISFGTLLGAIRHQGFIPWDDDVDIVMPLRDYNKLLSCVAKEDSLFLQCIQNDYSYFYLFSKLKYKHSNSLKTKEDILYNRTQNGAWIDIFPCIMVPDINSKTFRRWTKKRRIISSMLAIKSLPFNHSSKKKKFYKILLFAFPRTMLIRLIEKSSINIEKKKSKYFFIQDFWSRPERMILKEYNFNNSLELRFEGHFFIAPSNYDRVLTDNYGDYMILPPIEKRYSHSE